MSKKILVSICVPVYGVEKYIKRCAISLFEQTYENIEYVFVNDCTKDKSIEVLLETLEHYPNRKAQVSVINHPTNKGLAGARNTGVLNASGEFILWVDSDDYIDVSMVEKMIKLQMRNNSDIVCCDALVQFPRYNTYIRNIDYADGKDLSLKMIQDIAPHQLWGHLIRNSLYVNNNITAVEGVNHGEDLQVMPRLAYFANKISVLHEALYYYDMRSANSYSNNFSFNSYNQLYQAYSVLESFFKNKGDEYLLGLEKKKATFIADALLYFSNNNEKVVYNKILIVADSLSKHSINEQRLDRKLALKIRNKVLVKCLFFSVELIKKIKRI